MPEVISNTTPIISLLKINQLNLLEKIYGSVTIPYAVFQEIEQGIDKPYYIDITKFDWIHIQKIKDKKALDYFMDLDSGEAEVIVLASEIKAELVIIDEILGRRYAKNAGQLVTGTIGVLFKAKELKIIEKISPMINELQRKGTWISEKLKEKILKKANEI